jgi:hypothetical protein
MVNSKGEPVSVTILSGSGSKAADDFALQQGASLRFEPFPDAPAQGSAGSSRRSSGLLSGQLIFEWHTLPGTNLTVSQPQQ